MPQTPTFGRRGAPAAMASPVNRPRSAPRPQPTSEEEPFNFWRLAFSTQGRITRLHYWLGTVCIFVVEEIIIQTQKYVLAVQKGMAAASTPSLTTMSLTLAMELVFLALLALTFWASVALVVRRWHDRGRSWAWALLGFIPIFGWLWQGIECGFMDGTLGPNPYGPSPKGITGVTYGDPGQFTVA